MRCSGNLDAETIAAPVQGQIKGIEQVDRYESAKPEMRDADIVILVQTGARKHESAVDPHFELLIFVPNPQGCVTLRHLWDGQWKGAQFTESQHGSEVLSKGDFALVMHRERNVLAFFSQRDNPTAACRLPQCDRAV